MKSKKRTFSTPVMIFLLLSIVFVFLIIILSGQGEGEDIDCTLVSGFGGRYTDVEYSDSYAFTAHQLGVSIFDVSDPSDPELVGQYMTPGRANGVAIVGNYLFVADYEDGLIILDVSVKSSPGFIANYTTTGRALNVDVDGNYAYISDHRNGLEIIDITDKSDPQHVGNFDTTPTGGDDFYAYDVDIQGDYVYIAADRRFYIVDVSDKANPIEKSRLSSRDSEHISVSDNYAYLDYYDSGHDDTDLLIINVTDPSNPEKITTYDTPGGVSGVTILGDIAFIADWDGLYVLNITDKENPDLISGCDTEGSSYDLFYHNNIVYLADGSNGLSIVDVSNFSNPFKLGGYSSIALIQGLIVSGDYVYMADYENGLVIIDISDTSNPIYVGKYQNESTARGIAVLGNYAYLAYDRDDFIVVDISDTSNPTFVTQCEVSANVYSISASGDHVYLGNNAGRFFVYNVTQRDDPVLEGETTLSSTAMDIFLAGEYAYSRDYDGDFDIIDISDNANPNVVGEYECENYGSGIVVAGNYAYIDDGTYVSVLDISDKTSPELVSQYDTPGAPQGIALFGNYIFTSEGGQGLSVADISDPENPVYADDLPTAGYSEAIAVKGKYVFLSNRDAGLLIIDTSMNLWVESISPNPATDLDAIQFSGGVPDENAVQKFAWRSSIDGEFYNGVEADISYSDLSNGTHTIYFKVQFTNGSWSDEVNNRIFINGIPVAHIDLLSPNPALSRQRVNFEARGTDDGSITRYIWRSSIDGELYSGASNEYSTLELTNGTHTIYLKVRDDLGAWSEETSMTLEINGKPVAYIDSISPDPEYAGKPVTFSGHGTDDGSIEEYQWRSDLDGVFYLGSEDEFSISNLSIGSHKIYLKVRDNGDAWSFQVNGDLEILRNYSTTLFVGGSGEGNYSSIQSAIDDCFDGDSIRVFGGTYYENIIVNKQITLIGNGLFNEDVRGGTPGVRGLHKPAMRGGSTRGADDPSIINGSGLRDVVKITSDHVFVTGFQIENSKNSYSNAGIRVESQNNTLSHNNCTRNYYGINLYKTENNVVTDNMICDNYQAGILVVLSNDNIIENNTLDRNTWNGIQLTTSINITMKNNVLREHDHNGITLYKSSNNSILDNQCSNNGGHGIELEESSNDNHVVGNVLDGNERSGIYIMGSESNYLSQNQMFGCGIRISGALVSTWTTHSIDSSNTVNGRPIIFMKNQNTGSPPSDAGQIIIANCSWIVVEDQNLSGINTGMILGFSSNITLHNITCTDNTMYGIYLYLCSYTFLNDIECSSNTYGIYFYSSHHNSADNVDVHSNEMGILFMQSDHNILTNATMTGNSNNGILIYSADHNTINYCSMIDNLNGMYVMYQSVGNTANLNSIYNNSNSGILVEYAYSSINATNCWWGSDSGPYHAGSNPSGTGNQVTDNVIFDPWHTIPEARIIGIWDLPALHDEAVTLTGEGDAVVAIQWYVWASDIDGEFYRGYDPVISYSGLSNGTHIISFFVLDAFGFSSEEVFTTIMVHGRPHAAITSISPSPAPLSFPVHFMGTGTDDGSITLFSWSSSIDGEFYNGTNPELTHIGLTEGTHTIHFKLRDDQGAWSREVDQILIIYSKPIAEITSIRPESAREGESIHFAASAANNVTVLRYVWTSSLDGEIYNGSDPEFDYTALQKGTHTITLKIRDSQGTWSNEKTTTLEISGKGGGGSGEEFPFNKIGPIPIIAIIVIIGIVAAGGAGVTMRKNTIPKQETPPSQQGSSVSMQGQILTTMPSTPVATQQHPNPTTPPPVYSSSQPSVQSSPQLEHIQTQQPMDSAPQPHLDPTHHPASHSEPSSQTTQSSTSWTCPSCNKPVESQYAFCLQCGTKRQN